MLKENVEAHQEGTISLEDCTMFGDLTKVMHGDLGVQISVDGRVWIRINGVCFLSFKPDQTVVVNGQLRTY
jgi:hypothetical protein